MKLLIQILCIILLLVGCFTDNSSIDKQPDIISGSYYSLTDSIYREFIFTEDTSIVLVDMYSVTKSGKYYLTDSVIFDCKSELVIGFYRGKEEKTIWLIMDTDTAELVPIESLLYLDNSRKSIDTYLAEQHLFRGYIYKLKKQWESAKEDMLDSLETGQIHN